MRRLQLVFTIILLVCGLAVSLPTAVVAQAQPVVYAVLFYTPTCAHCHQVMSEDLPPLQQKYGSQLQIKTIDTSAQAGLAVYQAAVEKFVIPGDRQGVPTLVVGRIVLVGSDEIPKQFPALIESGLKAGGTPWPEIPGFNGVSPAGATSTPVKVPSFIDNWLRDPIANSLAVLVLLGMILVMAWEWIRRPWKTGKAGQRWFKPEWQQFAIPLLVLAGLLVSGYLSFVEVTASPAICGPVGECNVVQQSDYATLFGVLPVGVLGVIGNLSILLVWWFKQYGTPEISGLARKGLPLITTFGILFSIYLTFLEAFVIGATCMWCISSAVIMTSLFGISVETA